MKRLNLIRISIIIVLGGLGSILYLCQPNGQILRAQNSAGEEQAISQQAIVDNIIAELKQQGVPVNSAQIESDDRCNPPLILDFVLQSTSDNDKAVSDDPIYMVRVGHEVTLALRQGLNVGGIGTTFINSQGKIFLKDICATLKKDDIPSQFDPPFKMENTGVSDLLNQDMLLTGMVLNELNVYLDANGLREATFSLQVPDVAGANAGLSRFINRTNQNIYKLNLDQGIQIATYQITIKDTNGKPLFNYINDLLQGGDQCWWQADGITNWGFPQPVPVSVSSNKKN